QHNESTKVFLLILAAGLARRYGRAKQLEPVGPTGQILLDYAVHDARLAGFDRIVLVVRPDMEDLLRAHLTDIHGSTRGFAFRHQFFMGEERLLGTGHAVLAAATALSGPFGVCNADDYYGPEGFEAAASHLRTSPDGAVVGFPSGLVLSGSGAVSRALLDVADGRLARIRELHDVSAMGDGVIGRDAAGDLHRFSPGDPVSMNLWAFHPDILPMLAEGFERFLLRNGPESGREFLLSDAVGELIASGRYSVRVLHAGRQWMGLTFPGDRDEVVRRIEEHTASGRYPRRFHPGKDE
ncbi:MAG: nucleotidyltransferase family protein, partial [Gemmatimonadales bacterium]